MAKKYQLDEKDTGKWNVWLVEKPGIIALITFFFAIILSIIAFSGDFILDNRGDRFQPFGHEATVISNGLRAATVDVLFPGKDASIVDPERSIGYGDFLLFYNSLNGESVFTVDKLKQICVLEKLITDNADYKSYCLTGAGNITCSTPESVLNLIFTVNSNTGLLNYECNNINAASVTKITGDIQASINAGDNDGSKPVYFADIRFKANDTKLGTLTRSLFLFGLPHNGYNNTDHPNPTTAGAPQIRASKDQVLAWTKWSVGFFTELNTFGDSTIECLWLGTGLQEEIFNELVVTDSLFAIGSIALVFCYMIFHLKSVFLAGFGMMGILLSFPLAYFTYNIVFGIATMGTLNFLGLFVILGIGADDIFIMVDAWKQSSHFDFPDRFNQFKWAYKRAAAAMLVTSLTTAIAFAGNVVSIIPPIQEFGVFMALLVVFNYLLVITWFPAVLMFYSNRIQGKICTCCCTHQKETPTTSADAEDVHEEHIDVSKMRKLEKFFYTTHSDFLNKWKYYVLAFAVVVAGIGIGFTLQLEPDNEPAAFLPPDHPVQKFSDFRKTDFYITDSRGAVDPSLGEFAVRISMVFGIAGYDDSNIDETDLTDFGVAVFDKDFDLSAVKSQEKVIAICDDIDNNEVPKWATKDSVDCFMKDFKTWLEDGCPALNASSQIEDTCLNDATASFPIQDSSRFYELLASFRMNWEISPVSFLPKYFTELGFEKNNPTNLKFAKISWISVLAPYTPATTGLEHYDHWEEFSKKHQIDGLNNSQTTLWWIIMITEDVLVGTAILCAVVSVLVAFLVITISSRNLLVGIISTLVITCIVLSVVGFMVILGYKLGIIESINYTVVVGLAVDYVVHLAVDFTKSIYTKRFDKMRHALYALGISVFSAAVTTGGAALMLFFCQVLFFVKFGEFLFITIFFSLLWSLVFFTSIMFIIGPEGNDWDFKCCGKNHHEKDGKSVELEKDVEEEEETDDKVEDQTV